MEAIRSTLGSLRGLATVISPPRKIESLLESTKHQPDSTPVVYSQECDDIAAAIRSGK